MPKPHPKIMSKAATAASRETWERLWGAKKKETSDDTQARAEADAGTDGRPEGGGGGAAEEDAATAAGGGERT